MPRRQQARSESTHIVELPTAFKRLQSVLLKRPGGDRKIVEILAIVLHHDEQVVLCAVELALLGWRFEAARVEPAGSAGRAAGAYTG